MIAKEKSMISLLLLVSLLVFVGSSSIVFGHDSEIGLLNYMARSNELLQQDPTRSLNCFNKYIPLINEIANSYETNFKACINESEIASAKADEATLEQRNDLAYAAEASCALLKQCQEDTIVEEIFQCYIHGGSANIQTMYMINANASQELASLREQYYLIKNDQYKCTNETKRIYERESAAAYAGLNNCILGNSDLVTEKPSTTTESTTDAPTDAPAETTPETTSVKPETSDNPSTTTVIAESTARVPEETTSESPVNTTDGPSETTAEATTIIPESTEAVPEKTTSESPVNTTDEPSETTSEATTIVPESTEAVPQETTSESPVNTTDGPSETTADIKTTEIAP